MSRASTLGIALLLASGLGACGHNAAVRDREDGGLDDSDAGIIADAGDGGTDGSVAADGCGCGDSGWPDIDGGDGGVDLDAGTDPDGGFDADAGMSPDAGDPSVLADLQLEKIADAYRAFYAAELRWPKVDSFWDPRTADVAPAAFIARDTALFAAPTNLPVCQTTSNAPCWHGPFLTGGTTLGMDPWLDPWGHPVRVALVGVDANGNGAVVLWSVGPDGVDAIGCTTPALNPTCVVDRAKLVRGHPSEATSDDVMVLIQPAYDPVVSTQLLAAEIANSFRAFHEDTGMWPFAGCGWDPIGGVSPQIDPFSFTPGDDVLASTPDPEMCAPEVGLFTPSGWDGPYLWSDVSNLAEGAALDGWGNPLMYALIRPFGDGNGGGVASAPDGAVLIWSLGPDGVDQTGCSTGACSEGLDYSLLVQGLPSGMPSDDVVLMVGPAVTH